jgi:hypothetical protein
MFYIVIVIHGDILICQFLCRKIVDYLGHPGGLHGWTVSNGFDEPSNEFEVHDSCGPPSIEVGSGLFAGFDVGKKVGRKQKMMASDEHGRRHVCCVLVAKAHTLKSWIETES